MDALPFRDGLIGGSLICFCQNCLVLVCLKSVMVMLSCAAQDALSVTSLVCTRNSFTRCLINTSRRSPQRPVNRLQASAGSRTDMKMLGRVRLQDQDMFIWQV